MAILGVALFVFLVAKFTSSSADGGLLMDQELPQVGALRHTFQNKHPLTASRLGQLLAPSLWGLQSDSLSTGIPSIDKISTEPGDLSRHIPEEFSDVIPLKNYLEKKGVKVLFWKPDRSIGIPKKIIHKKLLPTTEPSNDLILMEFSVVTETAVPQTTKSTTAEDTDRKLAMKYSDEDWDSAEYTTEDDTDETTTEDWIEETTTEDEFESREETTPDGKFSGEEVNEIKMNASFEDNSAEYTTKKTDYYE